MSFRLRPLKHTAIALAAAATIALPVLAQRITTLEAPMTDIMDHTGIPGSIRAEHEEIHSALERATQEPGRVGQTARTLAKTLHPHFVREEQIALPPLGLLAALARGEFTGAMVDMLPMTDSLRLELPRMLEEHTAIRRATAALAAAARAERNAWVAELAAKLALHAQTEEEVLYPAAVLVGDLVRARAGAAGLR